MKHNKYLIFSLLGLVTLMSSCSNEENINSDRSATLSASIEETPATRLYMDGTTNKWTTGDAMKVWSDNTSTANDFTVVAGGNALADITGTQPTRTSVFYAVASKSNGNFVSGSGATAYVKFNVDDVSTANEMTSSNANFKNIMVGATDNGGNVIKFYNAGCLLKININNNTDKTIQSVRLDAINTSNCISNVKQNVTAISSTGITLNSVEDNGGMCNYKQKDVNIATNGNETLYFLLPVPVGQSANAFKITAYTEQGCTGTQVLTKTTSSAVTLEKNKIIDLGTAQYVYRYIVYVTSETGGNATISAVSNAVASGDNAYTTSTTGQAQVSASPLNSSYTFVGWYKNDGTQISTTTPLTITIKDYDSQTLIARWKATWTGNGADAGTVPNGGTINVP